MAGSLAPMRRETLALPSRPRAALKDRRVRRSAREARRFPRRHLGQLECVIYILSARCFELDGRLEPASSRDLRPPRGAARPCYSSNRSCRRRGPAQPSAAAPVEAASRFHPPGTPVHSSCCRSRSVQLCNVAFGSHQFLCGWGRGAGDASRAPASHCCPAATWACSGAFQCGWWVERFESPL
jgi:hypothetical protein